MSAPSPATEVSTGNFGAQPGDVKTYRLIPKLGPARVGDSHPSLLPILGGQPGLTYLQCPVTYLATAERDPDYKWQGVKNTSTYTLVGPLGQIDLKLMCSGTILQGSGSQSNRRECLIHKDVEEYTGLSLITGLPKTDEELTGSVQAEKAKFVEKEK